MDAALARFQKLSPTIGVGQMRAVLWAALSDNKGYQGEFVKRLNLSETAASGNLDFWTRYCKNKVKPPELLVKEQALEDRTQNRIFMTQLGERFIAEIKTILDPTQPSPADKDN
jgi:hypothetical protein